MDHVHQRDRGAAVPSRRREAGAGESAPFLTGLQATVGNRAVQRLVENAPGELDGAAISERIGAAEGSGAALDPAVAQQLAQTLGENSGDPRIHLDAEADALSRELGAKAFTSGRDIFFREGAFDPSLPQGFGLLAHEATHVLQQASGPVDGTPTADGALSISDPGDAFEQAASAHDASGSSTSSSHDSAGDSGGRPVQRDDDDWSPGSLFNDARSAANDVLSADKAALDFADTPFRRAAQSTGQATSAISQGIGWVEDQEKAASASLLPAPLAAIADSTTQIGGGLLDAGVTIGGGALQTVTDPIGAAENVVGMGLAAPSKMASGVLDATGDLLSGKGVDAAGSDLERGLGDSVNAVYGGLTEGDDAASGKMPKDAGLLRQVLDPFYSDHAKGKDAHAVGRGVGTIASFFLGGESGETPTPGGPEPVVPEEVPATVRDPIPSDEVAPTIRPNPDEVAPTVRPPALPDDLAPTVRRPPTPDEVAPTLRDPSVPVEPRVPQIRPGADPAPQIIPRNPDLAAPGSPGFFERADPLAPTQRSPVVIDPGADSLVDTRPAITRPGVGPDFEQPPNTLRDPGPPTLRDGPPTLRGLAPGQLGESPLAHSVTPENLTPLGPRPPGEIGPLGSSDFGPPQDLFEPLPGDPDPAPLPGPLPDFRGILPRELP
jgi:Domain of unknown function (DUF4157)